MTYDKTAPTATAGTVDLAAADDSGTSDSDNITKNTTGLDFSGTLSAAASTGEYVQLYNGTTLITGATDTSFTGTPATGWSISIPLAEGAHTIKAVVIDAAGNEGTKSSGLSVTVDTTAPTITASIGGTITSRTVKGVDTDSTSSWKYKIIDGSDTCDSTEMATGSSDYTEDSAKTVALSDNGKKACFSSTDTAGNVGYGATGTISVAGEVPTGTWTPTNGSTGNDNTINITVDFSEALYSDSGCATAMTNTTADNAVTLGTTDGGNDIATTVTYSATDYTITINPDSDLSDDTYYAE